MEQRMIQSLSGAFDHLRVMQHGEGAVLIQEVDYAARHACAEVLAKATQHGHCDACLVFTAVSPTPSDECNLFSL
jgi:hypothetical protein